MSGRKLYGEKCLKCQHLRHDNRDVELRWPVADDECQGCSFCQEGAFWGALIRACGVGAFGSEVRDALKAFRRGDEHPLIDSLRQEIRAVEDNDAR